METTLITWDETAINCANKKKEEMDNETSHGFPERFVRNINLGYYTYFRQITVHQRAFNRMGSEAALSGSFVFKLPYLDTDTKSNEAYFIPNCLTRRISCHNSRAVSTVKDRIKGITTTQ